MRASGRAAIRAARAGARLLQAAAWLALAACGPGRGGPVAVASRDNPVLVENGLPGDSGWQLHQRAGPHQLEGYAGEPSVERGEAVDVHVSADARRTLSWRLDRMGWYGGAEGRLVAGSASWVYAGTGAKDGDTIPGIVGYETDRAVDDGQTPPGTEAISRSPVVDVFGRKDVQQGAVHDEPSGAFVFAAGTIQWSWGLSRPGYADPRVQRITQNVFHRAGLEPAR